MKAKLFSEKSIKIIDDDKFQSMILFRAEIISKSKNIDIEAATDEATAELNKVWKDFIFNPYDGDKNNFSIVDVSYYEKDGVITNKWTVIENFDIATMNNRIAQYEAEISTTNDKIIQYCEMLIMGKPVSDIPDEAKELINKRNDLRKQITDIKKLKDEIINK